MKVLIVNCGSSSIKYALFNTEAEQELARGALEKIGEANSYLIQGKGEQVVRQEVTARDHREGLQLIIDELLNPSRGVVRDLSEISAVGHRVVHGGDTFFRSTVIDDQVTRAISEWAVLAPLHNPPNLLGIEAARSLLPGAVHVAVFDTAFHQTMPEHAFVYAIPYEFYEKYRVRRYGFHGTSHRYVVQKAAELLDRDLEELRVITCHLGNGCSVTAVAGGRSIDTSMGLTPLEGLVMGTRSGDIDPSIPLFIAEKEKLSLKQVGAMLNRRSGLLGVSGVSNDMREILTEAEKGHPQARLAVEVFAYRARKYIGGYAAALGGLDAIIFTGGIGENSAVLRSKICSDLGFLGVSLDEKKNTEIKAGCRVISTDVSPVKVMVVPTDEELLIARESLEVLQKAHGSDPGKRTEGVE